MRLSSVPKSTLMIHSFVLSRQVNYFGRQDEVDQIEISPILLQKGHTQVALYGLGSLRDERLNRMWERQKVRFLRPEEDEENDEEEGFFNIFALHQNRDLGRGAKNCVQEGMIPEWMDVVVWVCELFILFASIARQCWSSPRRSFLLLFSFL